MKTETLKFFSFKESHLPLGKRAFDIAFSFLALLSLSPLFVAIVVLLRLFTNGKVIYTQERLGQGGKTFKCFKFRTMVANAEEELAKLLKDPRLKKEWLEKQKLRQDPRVHRLGKFLRRTSLDELPQFWNVLKGDLSIVGPRPYMICQNKELGPYASQILSIRPGLTGLWQTSGRSKKAFSERVALDIKYIENQNFLSDLRLILKTIPLLFFSKDAF